MQEYSYFYAIRRYNGTVFKKYYNISSSISLFAKQFKQKVAIARLIYYNFNKNIECCRGENTI